MADCTYARRNRLRYWTSLILLAVPCLGAEAESLQVTEIRFWSLGDMTRVSVEVSADFKFKANHLSDPDRLFFDIQGARPVMAGKGVHTIPVNNSVVKQIRVAETLKDVTRIVLDLDQKAEFTASQLSHPNRLMIELRSKDKPSPPAESVTGVHTLRDPPAKPAEPSVTAPKSDPAPVEEPEEVPLYKRKLEPHKFVPPIHLASARPSSRREIKPELLALPPVLPTLARPVRVNPAVFPRIAPPPVERNLPPLEGPVVRLPASRPAPEPRTPVATDVTEPLPAKIPNGSQSLTRVLGLKLGRVVLDPGHGGHDLGTHGPSGLAEKDLVLDVAQRLQTLLENRLGSEVVLTRSTDVFIPLEERTHIANERRADLFLSIHANSSPVRSVTGVETYYLNFTTSRTALDLAARENAGSERAIFDLKDVLNKIALKDKIDESREFATRLQTSLYTISAKDNAAVRNRGVKKAPFVVLIGASMPSVLAEIGFLTNAADEALLRKNDHRDRIAEALYKGIAAYAETLSRFQVARTR